MSIRKLILIIPITVCFLFSGCNELLGISPQSTSSSQKNPAGVATPENTGNVDFSEFKGQWYSPGVSLITTLYQMELIFNENGNTAAVHIISYKNSKTIKEDYTVAFDNSGRGKLNEINGTSNIIILSSVKKSISMNVGNISIPIGTQFLRQSDIENISKCMDIVAEKEGISDWRNNSNNNSQDENAVYIRYEGKGDDGRYHIAVRKAKGTVIKYWYYMDPVTYEYETDR